MRNWLIKWLPRIDLALGLIEIACLFVFAIKGNLPLTIAFATCIIAPCGGGTVTPNQSTKIKYRN